MAVSIAVLPRQLGQLFVQRPTGGNVVIKRGDLEPPGHHVILQVFNLLVGWRL
jgi:hypothetical protein